MTVKRIVANLSAESVTEMVAFYQSIFDLNIVMDLGWIATLASCETAPVQISIALHGGSGTDVPDLSIEVHDLSATLARVRDADIAIEYGPVDEPWGVSRFYIRDPAGWLLNVLTHSN